MATGLATLDVALTSIRFFHSISLIPDPMCNFKTRQRVSPWGALLSTLTTLAFMACISTSPSDAQTYWVEGESAVKDSMHRHSWYDRVDESQLSGGKMISNFHPESIGSATYHITSDADGDFQFWIRANPVATQLHFSLNSAPESAIDLKGKSRGSINIAADGKVDLRFLAWAHVGTVKLKAGKNVIRFRMTSDNNHHGSIDCFVLTTEPFQPNGILKPGEIDPDTTLSGWFAFRPGGVEPSQGKSIIDLRSLNEGSAGENGNIVARDGQFWHNDSNQSVRFWAVNGPPENLRGEELQKCARLLARYGVNLIRVHTPLFDKRGEPDLDKVHHAQEIVRAFKAEGIYTHFSIYFPLWFKPAPNLEWLPGYDGNQHPFAALMFNPEFQSHHRKWLDALLLTPDPTTGERLIDEPAVFGVEIQNEDSFFFWTFKEGNLPDEQMQILEGMFAQWLIKKHGSLDAAFTQWNSGKLERDHLPAQRVAFRPLWNMVNQRTARDRDTAAFLLDTQTEFYQSVVTHLKEIGFKGLINASNWHTASPERLGVLEKLSYLPGDFIDRHGYFGCNHSGENSAWSIRDQHQFSHRSALKFESSDPTAPKQFVNPVMDPQYGDKPSMISETTFTRPNRFRSEAPLYYASYGALQDSDAIVHFALDGMNWSVKPRFWMQPWTLASPAMMGQFPAAAMIYRNGLIQTGPVVARVELGIDDLRNLNGTPLPQNASFDELRMKDLPKDHRVKPGQRLDPLLHYVGRTVVKFVDRPAPPRLHSTVSGIDHNRQTVQSGTGELNLDYRQGLLTIDAPQVQGISGNMSEQNRVQLKNIIIESEMDLIHVVAVSLDQQPLSTSRRILLQVMTEEQTSGFKTQPAKGRTLRIENLGKDPWQIKNVKGAIRFLRADAKNLTVTALNLDGYKEKKIGDASSFELLPTTLYYLIEADSE